jgi:hypothetical protein
MQEFGDDRLVVAKYSDNGDVFINQQQESPTGFRSDVKKIFKYREPPYLWITAERQVAYGKIVQSLSQVLADNPALTLIPITQAQLDRPVRINPATGYQNFDFDCVNQDHLKR